MRTTDQLRALYLDLVKRSLTGALAEDNDSILGGVRMQGAKSLKKRAANAAVPDRCLSADRQS